MFSTVFTPPPEKAGLQQQELAARLLLTRRELLDRIKISLRPLVRGQVLQILIGVLIILLGAQCWARNTDVPHRLISGIILHVYGVLVIASGIAVCTKIGRIDYSEPVSQIRERLDAVRRLYLRVGGIIGFPWWLLWIPATIAIGFDQVLHPYSLIPSLAVGFIGLTASYWLFWRVQQSSHPSSEAGRSKLAGKSIANAYLSLREIEKAQIL